MAKKGSKTKLKQKQKQKQTVIVNVTQASRRTTSKNAPQKSYLAQLPSFNINQPTPSPSPLSDLTKILGLLSPALQTQSRLGSAVNTTLLPPIGSLEREIEPINMGGLVNPTVTPSLAKAVQNTIKEEPPIKEEPEFQSPTKPLYASAAEEEPIPQHRKYKQREGPRRNSMADLEQRYVEATGSVYSGEKLKAKDFKALVQQLERKKI